MELSSDYGPPRKLTDAEWKKFVQTWTAHKIKIQEVYERSKNHILVIRHRRRPCEMTLQFAVHSTDAHTERLVALFYRWAARVR